MPNTFGTANYGRGNSLEFVIDPSDTNITDSIAALNALTITYNMKDNKEKTIRNVYYLITHNGQVYKHISILIKGVLTTLYSRDGPEIRGGGADSKGLEMKRDLTCRIPKHINDIFELVANIMKNIYDKDKDAKNKSKAISTATYTKSDDILLKCFIDQYAVVNIMKDGKIVDIRYNEDPEKLTKMAIRGTSLINTLFILPPLAVCLKYHNRILAVFKVQNVLIKPGQIVQNNYSTLENMVFSEEEKKQYNTDVIIENVVINKEEKNNTQLLEDALSEM